MDFTFDWRCRWELLNIYYNMRKLIELTISIIFIVSVIAVAFKDYFLFVAIPMWFFIVVPSIVYQWFKVIKPESLKIVERIQLQEDYKFFHSRFMK